MRKSLPVLTDADRQKVLVEWNDTCRDYPRNQCVHELFEDQVARAPEAVAVVCDGEQLTYQDLNRRANRLAHHLRGLGVGPEALVALCMERSLDAVVSILAVLKAGGAYVPLDPSYPKDRLAFMLDDTRAPLVLIHERTAGALPAHGAKVVCLEAAGGAPAVESDTNPASGARADNLAYVMYTSGSTGRPKGSCIPHRGVVRLVKGADYVHFGPDEVFLHCAPISFDASTFEIWGSLLHGARLAILSDRTPLPEDLARAIRVHRVTTLWLTAGLFHVMVDTQIESLALVRQLLAGGDVLSVPHVRRVLEARSGCTLINGYGPTENTTFTCCYPMRGPDQIGDSVPIGRPIANTQVYVLDEDLQPVPIGVPGELYAGGDGLARGYLNHPDLTAERFIPNPFTGAPGPRLYRTGDLVRYRPDGTLEFLGRTDVQVKIRGFRVEPGEIEAVLTAQPAVREAVVAAREDTPGEKRLVAYVVPRDASARAAVGLRAALREKLPEYMVPAVFVFLDALPLNPNGKVDRRALPAPEALSSETGEAFVAPRTPSEELLAGIWAEVLGVGRVGAHDNFFDLGGHSLKAGQIAARVRDLFRVELPLRSLFENPTLAGLAGVLEHIGCEGDRPAPAILPGPREGLVPLSFSQERVWFIQQLAPDNIAYNFQAAPRITGPLDAAVLERCLSEIVRRHEIFRTTFPAVDGRPIQVIHPAPLVKLPVVDLSALPAPERDAAAESFIHEEFRKPFELTQLPLIRWSLVRLNAQEHLLLHVEHHIVHDGWSFNVFLRELVELYTAFSQGHPSPLPELPIQFADFACWQREWMQGQVAEGQLAYWRQKLTGSPPVLELPTDRPRPAVRRFQGAAPRFELPPDLCESLWAFSRREGVTLFMTMLAGFVTLLHRYTGQTDIPVGSGIANRRWRETEGLIGMIINNMVLRANLSGDPSVREVLARVREVVLEASAHQDVPFDRVVEALQPKRNLSHNPLFQVMFSLHDEPMPDRHIPGLTVRDLMVRSNGSAKFDMALVVAPHSAQRIAEDEEEGPNGLTVVWEYDTDLFDQATVARMMGHYETLLKGLVGQPDRRIAELPIMTAEERDVVVVHWNATRAAFPERECLHHGVEAQAARTPEAVAVVFRERTLTYKELDSRANQVAHRLQNIGVGPDVPVAVCMERSLELAVGLLGILKAGGAYLPLDPGYPAERLAFMLTDSEAPVLLTQACLRQALPAVGAKVVSLDADGPAIVGEADGAPAGNAVPENLAYVIYTSGSTGQPKGVMIPHRAIVNHMRWMAAAFPLAADDAVFQKTPISFDASVWEFWAPLLAGARLVLAEPDGHRDPTYMAHAVADQGITRLQLVPSQLRMLLEEPRLAACSSLRHVFCGGEALAPDLTEQFFRRVPWAELYNLYGPTEATVDATCWRCRPGEGHCTVPIGRPIANMQIYLLDGERQPVPIGVPGEIYIGGAGLARGYLNRPELTAERFPPNPFSDEAGARLYRTGDLARYRPDGALEFLGRNDNQVKISGFRIELEEIEAVLYRCPGIAAAMVAVREDSSGKARVVAYLVPGPQAELRVGEVRSFLQHRLPSYMVPSAFILLGALPLTPSGKVDRRALLVADWARPAMRETFVPPRTPIEQTLADLWATVLCVEQVGVHDDFFDLRGNSLLATRLVARVRDAFRADISLRTFFENTTVASLATAIAGHLAVQAGGEELARMLAELRCLSDDDARNRLSGDSQGEGRPAI